MSVAKEKDKDSLSIELAFLEKPLHKYKLRYKISTLTSVFFNRFFFASAMSFFF